ncbi:Membrane-associated protein containing RNA-binding TRAM domain and ribonuclease PIN-domain, YacL B.subtilis ortholog [hydrothermal vent metagenome]|uniref:Membrane-associated protein containing RNA-binding TRAM domain and ribonuclease PIN-domain, YacL B.subtilis ortholog n=1 Tax=hydrothermal vent metagenome TaxID=652676 RepID=A0A3B0THV7_9ZZZZ
MTLSYLRTFFVLVSGVVGYYVGTLLGEPVLGAEIGCVSGLIVVFLEKQLQSVSMSGLSSLVFGLILGIFMAKLMSNVLSLLPLTEFFLSVSEIVLTLFFSYMGAILALKGKDEFNIVIPYVRFKRQDSAEGVVLLDTSAIIDGRVKDIVRAKFIFGRLVVLRSVLQELQKLADSENDIKRMRGRRGLELVKDMQNDPEIEMHVHEDDIVPSQGVDEKLLILAKMMEASICTTDFNLSRNAGVQGIISLNINELSQAVKPMLYSGEEFEIKLIKVGKESHQAVGFLEDGTMVIVSQASELVGQEVLVVVTSILQTQSGKMIFAKVTEK